MKLVPVKQAQAKLFNAPADKGLKSLTLATFKKDRSLTLERDGGGWLLVGTGDVPGILRFYERCGFERSHVVENFFVDNYDHPMYEEGHKLMDMVYLKMRL
mgnify:CR=1 FL=1